MYLLLQAKRVFWDPLRLKWGKGDPMGPARPVQNRFRSNNNVEPLAEFLKSLSLKFHAKSRVKRDPFEVSASPNGSWCWI
jgi:hypothetical protein